MKQKLFIPLLSAAIFMLFPLELCAESFALKLLQNPNDPLSENSYQAQKRRGSRAKKPLIIVGAALLGGVYVASIVIDHVYESDVIFDELYIPVVGPFLAIANYDDTVGPGYSGESFDKALFLISGALQTTGAVLLINGLAKKNAPQSKLLRVGNFLSKFSVSPATHQGLVASYRLQF